MKWFEEKVGQLLLKKKKGKFEKKGEREQKKKGNGMEGVKDFPTFSLKFPYPDTNSLFYYSFKLLELLVRITPFWKEKYIQFLGWSGYHLDRWRKKVIIANLQLAFPSWDEKKRDEVTRQIYRNFAKNLVEFIYTKQITTPEQLEKVVDLSNLSQLKEKCPGQSIFVTAHFGNWELIPLVIGGFIAPMAVVARKVDSEKLDREIVNHRQKFNVEVVYKKGALGKLVRRIRKGISIGILPDQNTAKREGIETKWFNRRVLQNPSPIQLALKFNLPIVVLFTEPTVEDKWQIVIRDRFYPKSVEEGVHRLAKIMEEEIERYPSYYFWFHKRFKHFYEEVYKGK